MHLPSYRILEISGSYSVFKFVSHGVKGDITKLIIFSEFNPAKKIFNLALVDVTTNGDISDTALSDNGDIRKILATVAQVTIQYMENFPDRSIYFQGSDEKGKRISVYSAAIRKYYYLLEKDFYIEGYLNSLVKEKYNPLNQYKGFLVTRK
jgi:hypothetical protein